MTEPPQYLDATARAAIHAAKNAAQAVEVARQEANIKVAEAAAGKIADKLVDEERMAAIVKKEMLNVLSAGTDSERAIILARVPYICASIEKIDKNLEEMRELLGSYSIVKNLVFGLVSLILIGVVGAFLSLVIIK